MKNVKCADCAEYKNEWCERKMDSPYPDMLRDCQYFCERRDLVEVVRCKDCKYFKPIEGERLCGAWEEIFYNPVVENGYCYKGERRDDVTKLPKGEEK